MNQGPPRSPRSPSGGAGGRPSAAIKTCSPRAGPEPPQRRSPSSAARRHALYSALDRAAGCRQTRPLTRPSHLPMRWLLISPRSPATTSSASRKSGCLNGGGSVLRGSVLRDSFSAAYSITRLKRLKRCHQSHQGHQHAAAGGSFCAAYARESGCRRLPRFFPRAGATIAEISGVFGGLD
jgi:hypothetical protein